MTVAVIGGGITGAACAGELVRSGADVRAMDRGNRLGGRMATRTLRGTGTALDGRPVDIGAAYFTAEDPAFAGLVDRLADDGVVRAWTDTFHVAGPDGIVGTKTGPIRYAATRGLRTVVEAIWADAGVEAEHPRDVVSVDAEPVGLTVDGVRHDSVSVCVPEPQARRIVAPGLGLPADGPAWEPVIAVTCLFHERSWDPSIAAVFVNDDPVLTSVADDGSRRGDDAPVLVAHLHPRLSAQHLDDPARVLPTAVAAVQRVLGIAAEPAWSHAHRWTFARPDTGRPEACWLHPDHALGLAGDAWAGGPRVEAAWLSGRALGRALAERASSGR